MMFKLYWCPIAEGFPPWGLSLPEGPQRPHAVKATPFLSARAGTSNRKPTALPKHPISSKLRVFQQYRRKAECLL